MLFALSPDDLLRLVLGQIAFAGIPADAVVRMADYEIASNSLVIVLEHPSFPPTELGFKYPSLNVTERRFVPGETALLAIKPIQELVNLARELVTHIEETDRSATGSIEGVRYARRIVNEVQMLLPPIS